MKNLKILSLKSIIYKNYDENYYIREVIFYLMQFIHTTFPKDIIFFLRKYRIWFNFFINTSLHWTLEFIVPNISWHTWWKHWLWQTNYFCYYNTNVIYYQGYFWNQITKNYNISRTFVKWKILNYYRISIIWIIR